MSEDRGCRSNSDGSVALAIEPICGTSYKVVNLKSFASYIQSREKTFQVLLSYASCYVREIYCIVCLMVSENRLATVL